MNCAVSVLKLLYLKNTQQILSPQTRLRLQGLYTEDLTRVVISHEIYETSLRRVSLISDEMTRSVRFCSSYDSLKIDFFAFQMNIISI